MLRLFVLCSLLVVTACGFTPLYGQRQTSESLAAVEIAPLTEREGQQLRLLLSDRFYGAHKPVSARYRLGISMTSSSEDYGIRADDTATRARRAVAVAFTLTDRNTGTVVLKGNERSFANYNIFIDPYATEAASANAQERALVQLADLVTNRVALFMAKPQQ